MNRRRLFAWLAAVPLLRRLPGPVIVAPAVPAGLAAWMPAPGAPPFFGIGRLETLRELYEAGIIGKATFIDMVDLPTPEGE